MRRGPTGHEALLIEAVEKEGHTIRRGHGFDAGVKEYMERHDEALSVFR